MNIHERQIARYSQVPELVSAIKKFPAYYEWLNTTINTLQDIQDVELTSEERAAIFRLINGLSE